MKAGDSSGRRPAQGAQRLRAEARGEAVPAAGAAPAVRARALRGTGNGQRMGMGKLALFALVPTVGLLAVLEAGLRLAGFGGQPPLFVPVVKVDDRTIMRSAPEALRPYFGRVIESRERKVGSLVHERFVSPKPEGLFRVFVLGESTVQGFPYPPNLAAASFLQKYLTAANPERRPEVLNLGVTAIASYPLRMIAREALKHEPDAVVIYAGHNEFYGAFGLASRASAGTTPWRMGLTLAYRRMGLYGLAELLAGGAAANPDADAGGGANLMAQMLRRETISPRDELRDQARASLVSNLEAVIRDCARQKVPVYLCTLAANDRDLPPVRSLGDPPADNEWGMLLREATQNAHKARQTTPSLGLVDNQGRPYLARLEGNARQVAELNYLAAKTAEEVEEPATAAKFYSAAREFDAMPWRAPVSFNGAIRELAAAYPATVTLVDVDAAFREVAQPAPGWDLFADHLHPNLAGQSLMAWTIARAMDGRPTSGPAFRVSLPDWAADSFALGAHPLLEYHVALRMAALFAVPPLDAVEGAEAHWRETASHAEAALKPHERRAYDRYQRDLKIMTPPPGHLAFIAGEEAEQAEALREAALYYRAAREEAPLYSLERAEASYRFFLVRRRTTAPADGERADIAAALAEGELLVATNPPQALRLYHAMTGLAALVPDASQFGRYWHMLTADPDRILRVEKELREARVPLPGVPQ